MAKHRHFVECNFDVHNTIVAVVVVFVVAAAAAAAAVDGKSMDRLPSRVPQLPDVDDIEINLYCC